MACSPMVLHIAFFSDLEKQNIMDGKPFLEFDLLDIQEPLVEELEKFTKAKFDVDTLVNTASDLKYTREIKHLLAEEYDSPKADFVRYFVQIIKAKGVYSDSNNITQSVIDQFTPITKRAFHEFVKEIKPDNPKGTTKYQPTKETTVQPPPPVIDEQGWQPLSALNPQPHDPRPISISFPDNSTVSIGRWKGLMVEVVRWLIDNNILNTSNTPISKTGRTNLVSTTPIHPNGKAFSKIGLVEIGSFYIPTNYEARKMVPKVKHIIQYVGQDPAQFKVRFP